MLHDLIDELKVAGGGGVHGKLETYLAVGVACIGKKCLRTFGIVSGTCEIFVKAPDALRNNAIFDHSVPSVDGGNDSVGINCHLQCLAHVDIREVLIVLVECKVRKSHPGADNKLVGVLRFIGGLDNAGIKSLKVNDVQFAILIHEVLGGRVGNDGDDRFLYGRNVSPVFVVVFKGEMVVYDPFRYLVGAGADGILAA